MAPDSPCSSLLAHLDKLRSQAASWLVLWIGSLLALGLLALASVRTETLPSGYLQGCSGHCASHMPLVCQNQWSCDTFCTNGYFQSRGINVETRANGEQYLAINDGVRCQSRCEKIRSAMCQGRMSCESMCTFLYHGATEPASKKSDPTWLGFVFESLTVCLLDVFFITDLLCSWLRLRCSFDFIRAHHDRRGADLSASELPRLEIDTKTFQCGMAIILRSVFEFRALFGSDSFDATILCLLLVDEALQYDAQELAAPQGVYVVSLFGRFLRAIVGRYTARSSDYSVPFATHVSSVGVSHASRSGHAGVAAPGAGSAAMAPPISTDPIKPSSKVE